MGQFSPPPVPPRSTLACTARSSAAFASSAGARMRGQKGPRVASVNLWVVRGQLWMIITMPACLFGRMGWGGDCGSLPSHRPRRVLSASCRGSGAMVLSGRLGKVGGARRDAGGLRHHWFDARHASDVSIAHVLQRLHAPGLRRWVARQDDRSWDAQRRDAKGLVVCRIVERRRHGYLPRGARSEHKAALASRARGARLRSQGLAWTIGGGGLHARRRVRLCGE